LTAIGQSWHLQQFKDGSLNVVEFVPESFNESLSLEEAVTTYRFEQVEDIVRGACTTRPFFGTEWDGTNLPCFHGIADLAFEQCMSKQRHEVQE